MFYLGLLLPVAFIPGYTGASVPTQWAVLSAFLPLTLWSGRFGLGHKVLLGFLCYALISLLWSVNLWSWVWGIWLACIWFICYHYGTLNEDLQSLWKGLALGVSVSAIVAVFQKLGYAPVESHNESAAGLFFNPSLFGIICGLLLVGLLCHRLWWYMPFPALGLVLSSTRGGLAVLALGLAARYGGWLGGLAVLSAGGIAFSLSTGSGDLERMQIYGVTVPVLSWLGNGAGQFTEIWFIRTSAQKLVRPEYVHNDLIQLTYEYGVGALAVAGLFGLALRQSSHPEWPVLFAWVGLSLFFFPLWAPVLAFIGLVCLGSVLAHRDRVRVDQRSRRPSLLRWLADEQFPVRVLGR